MVTDCQTRWGSTQKMISRILEQQRALTKVLSTDRKARQLLPSWQDLDVLESMNRALSPLQDFTDALSAEQYVSISYLKPILHILNTSVLAEDEEDTDLTKSLKAKILRYLNEKYEVTQALLNITTFLDPRFKAKYMSTEETRTIKERVVSEVVEIHQQQPEPQRTMVMEDSPDLDNSPPAAKAKKKTLASFFQNSTCMPSTTSTPTTFLVQCRDAVTTELTTYTYMPAVVPEEDPLKWWKHHKINFPLLSKLAQKYLCIQATSSASERAFSASGNVVSAHRSCLKPEKVDMLVFLSKNL
ncbi:zinc finger BED domain-containing protein 1-like isoform X2 [Stegastes partitus]|nr:PREDICTED: zinc finger BED domain-containing protein 1-like isoform X2 [Stegastes partitus]